MTALDAPPLLRKLRECYPGIDQTGDPHQWHQVCDVDDDTACHMLAELTATAHAPRLAQIRAAHRTATQRQRNRRGLAQARAALANTQEPA